MTSALLLIDLQNDFCANGALAVPEGEHTIPVALRAIDYAKQAGIPVIATQDWHPADHGSFASQSGGNIGETGMLAGLSQIWWPDHCIQHSHGADFHPQLNRQDFDFIVYKGTNPTIDSYSAFFDNGKRAATDLHEWLQQQHIKHLYIMGLATDYCVKFSVLDALGLGYQTVLITDGCRGVNLNTGDSQEALLEMAQAGAKLTPLDGLNNMQSIDNGINTDALC